MAKTTEPIWWSLFSAGGMVSAMFFPVLMVMTGFILPFDLVERDALFLDRIYAAVSHPIIKLILLGLISLPLFHWAHRFRYALIDMGLRKVRTAISILCYGSAITGTLVAAIVLWQS